MSKEIELLNAMQRFETRIALDPIGVGPNILKNVIARDAKLFYYLSRISSSMTYIGGPKVVFNVEYQNTEVSRNDIFLVSSGDEVQSVLCQHIGNYKTRLVLLAKTGVDVSAEYEKFSVVSAPFYPNYVGTKIISGKFSISPLPYYDFSFDYRIGKVKLAMMERETDAAVERIAEQMFLPGMSDETKAFLAHNYLAYTIEYTLKENISNLEKSYMQSAYGALIKRKCVCQGYAEAFKRLMDHAGIPCDIVCGRIKGASDYHAWNIIKLNGERDNYHIDATWDSAGSRVSHTYFGLKDSDLEGDRTWNREFNAICNSSKSLLLEGRRGIMRFKPQLIAKGVDTKIFGY